MSKLEPKPEPYADTLRKLANTIARSGMREPVAFVLDMVKPLDFISSQVALFVQPFTTGLRWERYTTVLTQESNWEELRRLLDTEKQ